MHPIHQPPSAWLTWASGALLAMALMTPAAAKTVPGDAGTPVVAMMGMILKNVQALGLTPEQEASFKAWRQQAMPERKAIVARIVSLRGQLRMAILDNAPQVQREALMQDIAKAEVAHFTIRNNCVEHVRATLSTKQFAQIRQMYLDGLQ